MENWENGGYMDNKNDIDVIDYDLFQYPRGKFRLLTEQNEDWCDEMYVVQLQNTNDHLDSTENDVLMISA